MCVLSVGESDIRIITITPFRSFPAQSNTFQPVSFTLRLDLVAQEINETLTLKLNVNQTLFNLPTDTLITQLNVTIIDSESKFIVNN